MAGRSLLQQVLEQQEELGEPGMGFTWSRRMNWGNLWMGFTIRPKKFSRSWAVICFTCEMVVDSGVVDRVDDGSTTGRPC